MPMHTYSPSSLPIQTVDWSFSFKLSKSELSESDDPLKCIIITLYHSTVGSFIKNYKLCE